MYVNLKKCLKTKGISTRAAALTIGMPEATFRAKMSIDGRLFSTDEAFAIKDELFPEMELRYLFKNEPLEDNQAS